MSPTPADEDGTRRLREVLRGRPARWCGALPGLHLDLSRQDAFAAVFDGESVEVPLSAVDPADVYGSVYAASLDALARRFAGLRRGTDRGTWTDCERMAGKVARKCERLPLFHAWLVMSS